MLVLGGEPVGVGGRLLVVVELPPVRDEQRQRLDLPVDDLQVLAEAAEPVARAEDRVLGDEEPDGLRECAGVEAAPDEVADDVVVLRAAAGQLALEDEPGLQHRHRVGVLGVGGQVRPVAGADELERADRAARLRERAAALDVLGERRHGRVRKSSWKVKLRPCARALARTATKWMESPPSAKKSSSMPTVGSSSTSAQIPARIRSLGGRAAGPPRPAPRVGGAGSARRSSLPFGVSGSASSPHECGRDHVVGQRPRERARAARPGRARRRRRT